MLRILVFFLITILTASSSLAVPAVTNVTGTVSNGQTITITGTGFGANGPTVLIFDDFDTGSNGSNISISGPRIGAWTSTKTANQATYTNADKVSGSLAGKFNMDSGTSDVYGNLMLYSETGWNEIFFSAWVKVPTESYFPTSGQANWKLWWLDNNANWGGTDSTDLVVINPHSFSGEAITFGNSGSIVITSPGYSQGWWNEDDPHMTQNIWLRYSFWIKGHPTAGNFHAWVLAAGSEISKKWEADNVKTMNDIVGDDLWHYFSQNAWANSGSSSSPCYALYDDIYIASGQYARARIEIGDNATYTSCTNMTTLTPTSWGDTSITATVRQGSFTNGTAYLYVFDSTGVANSTGYPVTFGSGSPSNKYVPWRH